MIEDFKAPDTSNDNCEIDSCLKSNSSKMKGASKSFDPFIERSKKWKMVKFKEEGDV